MALTPTMMTMVKISSSLPYSTTVGGVIAEIVVEIPPAASADSNFVELARIPLVRAVDNFLAAALFEALISAVTRTEPAVRVMSKSLLPGVLEWVRGLAASRTFLIFILTTGSCGPLYIGSLEP